MKIRIPFSSHLPVQQSKTDALHLVETCHRITVISCHSWNPLRKGFAESQFDACSECIWDCVVSNPSIRHPERVRHIRSIFSRRVWKIAWKRFSLPFFVHWGSCCSPNSKIHKHHSSWFSFPVQGMATTREQEVFFRLENSYSYHFQSRRYFSIPTDLLLPWEVFVFLLLQCTVADLQRKIEQNLINCPKW